MAPIAKKSKTARPAAAVPIPTAASLSKTKKDTYEEMIVQAVKSLDEPKGTSLQSIKKFLLNNFSVSTSTVTSGHLKRGLEAALNNNRLIRLTGRGLNGSFKLPKSKKPQKKSPSIEPPADAAKKTFRQRDATANKENKGTINTAKKVLAPKQEAKAQPKKQAKQPVRTVNGPGAPVKVKMLKSNQTGNQDAPPTIDQLTAAALSLSINSLEDTDSDDEDDDESESEDENESAISGPKFNENVEKSNAVETESLLENSESEEQESNVSEGSDETDFEGEYNTNTTAQYSYAQETSHADTEMDPDRSSVGNAVAVLDHNVGETSMYMNNSGQEQDLTSASGIENFDQTSNSEMQNESLNQTEAETDKEDLSVQSFKQERVSMDDDADETTDCMEDESSPNDETDEEESTADESSLDDSSLGSAKGKGNTHYANSGYVNSNGLSESDVSHNYGDETGTGEESETSRYDATHLSGTSDSGEDGTTSDEGSDVSQSTIMVNPAKPVKRH